MLTLELGRSVYTCLCTDTLDLKLALARITASYMYNNSLKKIHSNPTGSNETRIESRRGGVSALIGPLIACFRSPRFVVFKIPDPMSTPP